eukprot:5902560-Pleurochrysis_carterae.AAC.1
MKIRAGLRPPGQRVPVRGETGKAVGLGGQSPVTGVSGSRTPAGRSGAHMARAPPFQQRVARLATFHPTEVGGEWGERNRACDHFK